jgi:hypothetical protein
MKKFLMALAIICIASPALATGPNEGGTLVIHDSGVAFSTVADLPVPPVSAPPATCDGIDYNLPEGTPTSQIVWKVYAAFPDGSSPRVKGLAWGITGTGAFYVTTAGLPDPPNCFQVVQGSWPSPPGSIGQSFVFPQTAQIVECYWFGGYGYAGGLFSTAPHSTNASDFVDDATPGNIDHIAGFSSIGFGANGTLVCPSVTPPTGACCHPDGSCEMLPQDACVAPNVFYGGDCLPGLCPVPVIGACCLPDHTCTDVTLEVCTALNGVWTEGVQCTPTYCIPNPTENTSWGHIKANYR